MVLEPLRSEMFDSTYFQRPFKFQPLSSFGRLGPTVLRSHCTKWLVSIICIGSKLLYSLFTGFNNANKQFWELRRQNIITGSKSKCQPVPSSHLYTIVLQIHHVKSGDTQHGDCAWPMHEMCRTDFPCRLYAPCQQSWRNVSGFFHFQGLFILQTCFLVTVEDRDLHFFHSSTHRQEFVEMLLPWSEWNLYKTTST